MNPRRRRVRATGRVARAAFVSFYAYYKTKAGWTPAQIRAGIARHEYESIDLDKQ